jgi:hypothetical protein
VEGDAQTVYADDPSEAMSILNEFTHTVIEDALESLHEMRIDE